MFLQLSICTSTIKILPLRYNDFYFRIIAALLAAHCIVAFGDKETLFQLLLDKYYYMALGSSFVIALVLVTTVNFVTKKLDKHYDWKKYPVERTGLQILAGLVFPAVVALLLAALYFKLNGLDIFKTLYFQIDFPVIAGMILLFNIYYLAYYFYLQMRIAESNALAKLSDTIEPVSIKDQGKSKEVILVNRGAKSIPIQLDSVCYFYHDGSVNFVRTFEREDFLMMQSLDELQKQLPQRQFFRVNRQMIVNFSSCEHFTPAEFGKLELYLKPATKERVFISQKRAKAFKVWIER